MIGYSLDYGLSIYPIDNEEMKLEYERRMRDVQQIRALGRDGNANKLEAEALEDYIGGREHCIVEKIIEQGTQINLIGRVHTKAIVGLLTERDLVAHEESVCPAEGEYLMGQNENRYQLARERYMLRNITGT